MTGGDWGWLGVIPRFSKSQYLAIVRIFSEECCVDWALKNRFVIFALCWCTDLWFSSRTEK